MSFFVHTLWKTETARCMPVQIWRRSSFQMTKAKFPFKFWSSSTKNKKFEFLMQLPVLRSIQKTCSGMASLFHRFFQKITFWSKFEIRGIHMRSRMQQIPAIGLEKAWKLKKLDKVQVFSSIQDSMAYVHATRQNRFEILQLVGYTHRPMTWRNVLVSTLHWASSRVEVGAIIMHVMHACARASIARWHHHR